MHASRVENKRAREVFADNLNRIIKSGRIRHVELAKAEGVSNGPLGEWRHAKRAVYIDALDAVSARLELEPWQLLYPDLDPANPPQIPRMSHMALDAARIIDSIADENQKRKAYALIVQAIEMANPQMPAANPQTAPAPSAPPTSKRARAR